MKKKTKGDIWNEFTYGAWWIPFPTEEQAKLKRIKRKEASISSMMKYCPDCDNVYEVNQVARPRQIFYFSNMPKRQTVKTCSICNGKNYTIIKY